MSEREMREEERTWISHIRRCSASRSHRRRRRRPSHRKEEIGAPGGGRVTHGRRLLHAEEAEASGNQGRGRAARSRRSRRRRSVVVADLEGTSVMELEGARGRHLHCRAGQGGSVRPPSIRRCRTSPRNGSSPSLRGAGRGRRGEAEEGSYLRAPTADLSEVGQERSRRRRGRGREGGRR